MSTDYRIPELISQTFKNARKDLRLNEFSDEELQLLVTMACHFVFGRLERFAVFTNEMCGLYGRPIFEALIEANYQLNNGKLDSHMHAELERLCRYSGFNMQEYSLKVYDGLQK